MVTSPEWKARYRETLKDGERGNNEQGATHAEKRAGTMCDSVVTRLAARRKKWEKEEAKVKGKELLLVAFYYCVLIYKIILLEYTRCHNMPLPPRVE